MTPRILFLADINSSHTQKWATGLASDSFEVGIFSLNHSSKNWWNDSENITCLSQPNNSAPKKLAAKLNYLFFLPKLIWIILKFRPNVIHAHYASSYGLLGALTLFKPLFVSAWGSDIMEFPKKNIVCKLVTKFVLFRARKIFVTSSVLKKEIAQYTGKEVTLIPFGINLNKFYHIESSKKDYFTFGCIKYLEKIYNIDKVIIAFNWLVKKYQRAHLQLIIVGDGSERERLEQLVSFYGLTEHVKFTGEVPHSKVPFYLNKLDVLVNVSETESFGVSVAEALACRVPVIVSNIEGFKDIIPDKTHGLITRSTQPEDILFCMEDYLLDAELRNNLAKTGYQFIREKFNWNDNLKQMEEMYFEFV